MAKLSEGESSGDLLENQQQIPSKQSHCRKSILPNFLPDLKENHIFVEYDTEETGLEINVKSGDLRQTQLNGYIVDWVGAKHKRQTRDLRLWKEYIQSFKDWTIEIFNFTNEQACNDLRDYLRTSGVFVNSGPRARVQDALIEVLNESKPHVCTKAEVEEVMEEFPHQFNSKYNTDLDLSDQRSYTQHSADLTRKINQQQEQKSDIRHTQENYRRIQNQTPPNNSSYTTNPNYYPPNNNQNRNHGFNSNIQNIQQHSGPQSYPLGFLPQPIRASSQNHLSSNTNSQENFLSQNINNLPVTANIGRELGTLQRIYQSDMQYVGASDDFDLCLKIFYDQCRKAGVPSALFGEAFSIMLKDKAREFYYDRVAGHNYQFQAMITQIQQHFETHERRQQMLQTWNTLTLSKFIEQYPEKSVAQCFELLLEEMHKTQRGLAREYQTDNMIRDNLINACRDVKECAFACFKPSSTLETLCADIRSAIGTSVRIKNNNKVSTYNASNEDEEIFYTDRKYHGRPRYQHSNSYSPYKSGQKLDGNRTKKCFVCHKPGCWSTNHSQYDHDKATSEFKKRMQDRGTPFSNTKFQQFITEFEGMNDQLYQNQDRSEDHLIEAMIADMILDENSGQAPENAMITQYTTDFGTVDGLRTLTVLRNQATSHAITCKSPNSTFIIKQRYSDSIFQGIIIDTGAAKWSTAGQGQFKALQRLQKIDLDTSKAGQVKVLFGIGQATSIGAADVLTPIGVITFHVVPSDTPFLLSLQDMDDLQVKFDNLKNALIQNQIMIPIVRKNGHPFMLLDTSTSVAYMNEDSRQCQLTTMELRQLHRRFGHPSVNRLQRVLERSGHEVDIKAIKNLTKFCHECQTHGKSPGRFKFTLHDDCDFNFSIYIDIMYIDSDPLLHVVDEATRFEAARWVKSMTAQHAWEALRACWIDVYIGPPDIITHDAGKNFASSEFRQNAASMSIITKEVPVEAHNSVGKVERYHGPLRRAYDCIKKELHGSNIDKNSMLQMAVKAVNDTAGPDDLVPTLLVFGAYPRMAYSDPPSASISKRASAIKSAMEEVRIFNAKRQVADALAMRNGPKTQHLRNLNINADVLVWREKNGWTGPHKLLSTTNEECIVALDGGISTRFRSTTVKPYFKEILENKIQEERESQNLPTVHQNLENFPSQNSLEIENPSPNVETCQLQHKEVLRRRSPRNITNHNFMGHSILDGFPLVSESYVSSKELHDLNLSKILRAKGIITTPGSPFQISKQVEIEGLKEKGVFEFISYDPKEMNGIRIFNSRLVNEIKGKATSTPYEKSRLVIQAYNDEGKSEVLTQSPTIQRMSQRLILALTPSLQSRCKLFIRDITQAYVQSKSDINRVILANPPKEILNTLPPNTIMKIIKPLYGIPEAGIHWFNTYHKHHRKELGMRDSTYDPCLLITTNPECFGLVGIQTDDTLFLGDKAFTEQEERALIKSKLLAKPHIQLKEGESIIFNGGRIFQNKSGIVLLQKDQGDRIELINIKSSGYKQTYLEQRARGAYIATICQPEAAYDLSRAAQFQNPTSIEVKALNKRLQWQIENKQRGLQFLPLNLSDAKLYVFVDASFANNTDLSSQIGYVIVLANEREDPSKDEFIITGNILTWSSIKCKRVTRSVLASELYSMVHGVDTAIALGTTLNLITTQLNKQEIPIVVCTDSLSLYECMVKLGTTEEKRLMIDIMGLRQSYERREISEIRWINGNDNPADSMTKNNANKALQSLIDKNKLTIGKQGWVERMS